MFNHLTILAALTSLACQAEQITLKNSFFDQANGDQPVGWTLSGGEGQWLGKEECISVTGNGKDTNFWRSENLPFKANRVYRIQFKAKSIDASGGTPITGPIFCNRDLRSIPSNWNTYTTYFITPRQPSADSSWLRFGQWHTKGSVAFDDIELTEASPIYTGSQDGKVFLGEGELIEEGQYRFKAPFHIGNQSRPLEYHNCHFNTDRWVFGSGSEVVYRLQAGRHRQRSARVEFTINYRSGGRLAVEAAGKGEWQKIGEAGELGTFEYEIPKSLFPAELIRLRFRSMGAKELSDKSDPGSLQINRCMYVADLQGKVPDLTGSTRYLVIGKGDERLMVDVVSLGVGLPGARNQIQLNITNTTDQRIEIEPTIVLKESATDRARRHQTKAALRRGKNVLKLPYEVPDAGEFLLTLSLGKDSPFIAQTSLLVPSLYQVGFGRLLPGSDGDISIWGASSGWKISSTRQPPVERGPALLIRAARNETEAAQLVLRPSRDIADFTVEATDLAGPRGSVIASADVEILKVRYVKVTQPTDRTGTAGLWPDPLPPFEKLSLSKNQNQPLWIRVKAPRDAKPGLHKGKILLKAKGYLREIPFHVYVFNFELPDRMTCATAFGFRPNSVWRYQNITNEEQRRDVLEKYFENFSEHHISPYDPAPLDRLKVTWPTAGFTGGKRDLNERHSGKASLLLDDTRTDGLVSARFNRLVPIPKDGFKLQFWFKAKKGHQFIVTLNHHDAEGVWMSGRNNDMRVSGAGKWSEFVREIRGFPKNAAFVKFTLWATLYSEDGSRTGAVHYDDLSLQSLPDGKEQLGERGFEPLSPDQLKPELDWSAWDKSMEKAISTYHFNSFRLSIPGLGGGSFHARYEPSLLGYDERSAQYKSAFSSYCRAVQHHLEEKGWLDEAFVYWFDEPDPKDYEFVSNGFRKLKQHAPKLRRMLTEQVEPGLIGGPNLWCPVSHHYDHETSEPRRAEGEAFWWYVCTGPKAPYCTLFIDHPATELRVWLWQTWQRKIEGILIWTTNYWTSSAAYPDSLQNPYEDPMGWVSGYSTPAGTKRAWGNGDGRFIYPPESAADGKPGRPILDGPVDSIRWEMLRDGIEDYEYLAILKKLLEEKGDKLSKKKREEFEALLEVPAEITSDMVTFTKDPRTVEERRMEVARAIEQLVR